MHYLVVTFLARFLVALEIILDKFLLSSKRVSHPAIYTFYSGLLSSFVLVLIPFGFHFLSPGQILESIIAGMLFGYGILLLFYAIRDSEASRVMPVVGAIVPIITYPLSFFVFGGEQLTSFQLGGTFMLILGGLLISYDYESVKKKKNKLFSGFYFSCLAGIFLAVSFTLNKDLYQKDTFLNIFIWTRFGFIIGALSLLFVFPWRKKILASITNFKKPKEEHYHSGGLFVVNKIIGGVGSIILNYAISIGSVTIVNALVALEYVFVFILGFMFSRFFPSFFEEKTDWVTFSQKVSAIVIISVGIYLVYK